MIDLDRDVPKQEDREPAELGFASIAEYARFLVDQGHGGIGASIKATKTWHGLSEAAEQEDEAWLDRQQRLDVDLLDQRLGAQEGDVPELYVSRLIGERTRADLRAFVDSRRAEVESAQETDGLF